jgi:outer membrane protein assembly factor BamB
MARMRRKVAAGVVVLVLVAVGGVALAYTRLTDQPNDAADTELAGVSVEAATDTGPSTTLEDQTTTTEIKEPSEECWREFGGDPQRQLSRPLIDLGRPTRVLWSRPMGDLMEYPPTFCDGRLYVALEHGGVVALDSTTGRRIWRQNTRGPHASSPAIYDTLVIVSSHDGSVTAFRRDDGRKVWRIVVPGKVESSPVVVDGTAYFGSTEGRLYAVNANKGTVRWAYDTGGRINASPSIFGDRICIPTYAGGVFCFDRRNGRKLWDTYVKQNAISYESFYASASTDGARLYTTSRAGKIVALSAKSGKVIWTFQMGGWGYATPAIANGRVYVGGFDGHLRAFRATNGRVLWDRTLGGRILAPALVVGDLVFVSTLERDTYALRTSDGKVIWHRSEGGYSPGIATDRHYFFSLRRVLYAYRGENSPREAD